MNRIMEMNMNMNMNMIMIKFTIIVIIVKLIGPILGVIGLKSPPGFVPWLPAWNTDDKPT